MTHEAFSPEQLHFLQYLQRTSVINKRTAKELIGELEEVIQNKRSGVQQAASRIEKNILYGQIENRKEQIKWANNFLK